MPIASAYASASRLLSSLLVIDLSPFIAAAAAETSFPSDGSQCSRLDLSINPVWMPASRLAAADRVSGVSGVDGAGST